MTNHQVNDLAHSFVAMATAFERLPQVEADLKHTQENNNKLSDTVADREIHIQQLKAEIDKLHSTIRELEVAKDAAETMFLEADDRTTRALEFVKTMFGSAGSLIQALEPPKPQPVEPPQVASTGTQDMTAIGEEVAFSYPSNTTPNQPPVPEVAEQPDPTHVDTVAEPQAATVTDTSSNLGPFTNRRYIEVPGWISRDDWKAGGGTDESYDYRPGRQDHF